MIKLLIGQPGAGKTKEMIAHANEALKEAKGNIVFIDESNESLLELNHDIRYIDISEFPVNSSNEFIAFLHGLMGSNYDIEKIYIDGILNVYILSPEEVEAWLEKIAAIASKHSVQFVITWSHNGEMPHGLSKYLS